MKMTTYEWLNLLSMLLEHQVRLAELNKKDDGVDDVIGAMLQYGNLNPKIVGSDGSSA